MRMVKQLVGFLVFVAFVWVVDIVQGVLATFGAPGFVSWPVAVVLPILVTIGAFAGWRGLQALRLLSRPGVKAWKDLDDRAFSLQKSGDLAAAVPLYEQAVPAAEATGQPGVIATAANNLAGAYAGQDRFEAALPLFQRAYEVRKQAFGAVNEVTLTTGERLTSCAGQLGRWAEVEALQRELMPSYVKGAGADSMIVLQTMHQIAVACRHQGNHTEAARLYQEEESILKRKNELQSPEAGALYNDWAYMLVASGSPAAALPLYDRAIAIREKHGIQVALATSLDNRADAQTAIGDAAGAAATSQRWLEVMDRFLSGGGDAGKSMLEPVLVQHAARLEAAGRSAEAADQRRRAQEIRREHPEAAAQLDAQMARMANIES